jgi:uncharacterized protein (TIGR03067 family)
VLQWQVLFAITAAYVLGGDDARMGRTAIQGNWQLATLEVDGKKIDLDNGSPPTEFTFAGDRLRASGEDLFSVTLDTAASPKLIDFTSLKPDEKGRVLEGIYRLRDSELTICVFTGEGARMRPLDFSTAPGSKRLLVVLRKK